MLAVDRMDQIPGHAAPVHALVLGHRSPVPALTGELHGIPLGILVQLEAVGPKPVADAVGILRPHWDGGDPHMVPERYATLPLLAVPLTGTGIGARIGGRGRGWVGG